MNVKSNIDSSTVFIIASITDCHYFETPEKFDVFFQAISNQLYSYITRALSKLFIIKTYHLTKVHQVLILKKARRQYHYHTYGKE